MQNGNLFIFIFIAVAITSCQDRFDPEKGHAEILALHQGFIDAHLREDTSPLVAPIPDDYLFVSNGDVDTQNAEDVREMLQNYFDTTTFSHYADTNQPIIGFSTDGTLAWAIVRVRVAGTSHREPEAEREFDTQWAWITLYEKRNDEWSRIADVSTNRPFTP
jgi:ketosteroid isomerase-like protein